VASGIIPGRLYAYKIRAKNKWGWSLYSPTSQAIIAATVPERVNIPVTQISADNGDVLITWEAPFENGAPIGAYQVEINNQNGLWQ